MIDRDDPFVNEMGELGPAARWAMLDPERIRANDERAHGASRRMNRLRGPDERQKRFPLIRFDNIPLGTSPRYRVRGILPITGLAVVWGPPKSGKSFLIFDLLMRVAYGWPYRGKRVRQGAVVYCALEGQSGFEARAAAFRQEFVAESAEPVPFYLMPAPMSLVRDATTFISRLEDEFGESSGPAVVCLDTLNRSFAGSESDDEAMTAYVAAADAIRDRFGCLVVIVHHCGIDGSRPRGHTALIGAVDAQLAVKKASGLVTLTIELLKDGEAGEEIVSRMRVVEVGTDDEGDPITSLVVEPVEGEAAPKAARKRITDRDRLGLEALREALIAAGTDAPATLAIPTGTKVVGVDAWKDELFRRGVLVRDVGNPRETFRRIKVALMAHGAVAERDGLAWIIP